MFYIIQSVLTPYWTPLQHYRRCNIKSSFITVFSNIRTHYFQYQVRTKLLILYVSFIMQLIRAVSQAMLTNTTSLFIIRRCVSSAYSKLDLLYKYISSVIICKILLLTYCHAMFITGMLSYSLTTSLFQMLFFKYCIYLSIIICARNLNLHSQYGTSVEELHASKTHQRFRSCNSWV